MNAVVRAFRLDVASWHRVSQIGTMASALEISLKSKGAIFASAVATAIGSFAFFAFDRFGFQAFIAPRATTRILLVGLYGWLGLSAATLLLAHRVTSARVSFVEVVRIFGYAHLPLLILGFAIQLVAVVTQVLGPSLIVAIFAFAVWMPASLIAATRYLFEVDVGRSIKIVLPPYAVWALLIGAYLWRQIGHLL